MKSLTELKALNGAKKIFDKYSIDPSLHGKEGYYVTPEDCVYDIVTELVNFFANTHPLWNFGKFPHERDE